MAKDNKEDKTEKNKKSGNEENGENKKQEQNKANTEDFKRLIKYIERLQKRYTFAIHSFYAWGSLQEIKAPNIVRKDIAKENVRVLRRYNNFFTSAENALQVHFSLELAKMFDNSNQSLHIDKIINYTESNIEKLTAKEFREYSKKQDRTFIKELVKKYKKVNHSDIKKIREMRNKHEKSIEELINYRNEYLAHDDIKKNSPPKISPAEIKDLFRIILEILNLISGRLNHEEWFYDHVEDGVKSDTCSIIDTLRQK